MPRTRTARNLKTNETLTETATKIENRKLTWTLTENKNKNKKQEKEQEQKQKESLLIFLSSFSIRSVELKSLIRRAFFVMMISVHEIVGSKADGYWAISYTNESIKISDIYWKKIWHLFKEINVTFKSTVVIKYFMWVKQDQSFIKEEPSSVQLC